MDERISSGRLDVLKEVSTIGAGRAATAMSDLIGAKVEISVPEVKLVPIEQMPTILDNVEQEFFVLEMGMERDVNGRIFLLLTPKDAKIISSTLLHKAVAEVDFESEIFISALKESGNILSGAFVSALADMTHLNILNTVPSLAIDMVGAILDFIFIQVAQDSEEALYIKTDLSVSDLKLDCFFLFFPNSESLETIFKALRM